MLFRSDRKKYVGGHWYCYPCASPMDTTRGRATIQVEKARARITCSYPGCASTAAMNGLCDYHQQFSAGDYLDD